ncbi:hypothetical protein SUGI_1222710 [Cryptomeria japonica]|uniref:Uncharacterized protein n=1 Tax=Cryptomeria japonica TaxID=3369 RepID=A0AAD3NNV7_CRYJA|nr:hypothetical protein SUGI_1222710 [Cryptomeria japonica]
MGKIYKEPLKIRQLNSDTEEKPRLASIGDYWDEKTISEVAALLIQKSVDLFPQNFTEMKGIKGEIGEMWIELKPDAMPSQSKEGHTD